MSVDLRVLLAEDEFVIAMGLEIVLEDAGFTVVGPCLDQDTLTAVIAGKDAVDIALLDYNLGSGTTAAAARSLRADGIPTVFLTGLHDEAILAEFPDATILRKPVQPDQVVASLRDVAARECDGAEAAHRSRAG